MSSPGDPPGGAKARGERIKAAIRANRETLRRLAK
jgi:hypothetical protein